MIETRKAHELDIVELIEDLPEYDIKRGERGTVVEVFDDPEEAYMLEFVDESGTSSRLADWVKPHQIRNIDALAKGKYERGATLFEQGKIPEAEREFEQAVSLKPGFIGVLHSLAVTSFGNNKDWAGLITSLRFILRIDPSYATARSNLAISYINYGVQIANEGNITLAGELFQKALGIPSNPDVLAVARSNIAAAFTYLGMQAHQREDFELARHYMLQACAADPNEVTRRNLGLAYAFSGKALLGKARYKDSITRFEWAEDTGLLSPETLNEYGIALSFEKRFDEAMRAFERALALAPDSSAIRRNIQKSRNAAFASDFVSEEIKDNFTPFPSMHEYQVASLT